MARIRQVDQTELHDPDDPEKVGDCWRACIAMVTDRPIEAVPHFAKDFKARWWIETMRWLRLRGFALVRVFPLFDPEQGEEAERLAWWSDCVVDMEPGTAAIWSGLSPRSPFGLSDRRCVLHSVVRVRTAGPGPREVEFDPHPSRDGIVKVTAVEIVVPYSEVADAG